MCTAGWFPTEHGYELFFNRDELRTRGRAEPPRRFTTDSGLRALAPVDTDAGGTWIAVNAAGLTVALLNRYQDSADPGYADRRRSRGLLVKDLAGAESIEECVERVESMDARVYAPFTLLLLAPGEEATTLFWDGRRLSSPEPAIAPLASSGHDPLDVPEVRREQWSRLPRIDRQTCLEFHGGHEPRRGAESPCMHRPEARTVSLTHVMVDRRSAAMDYADGPPCRAELQPAAELELRRSADADAA